MKILIVGGVAGGASAATRARRMNEDAEIILFEKDGYVSFANCGLPYYIGGEIENRDSLLVATPEFLRLRFNLDVRIRQEVTSIDRSAKTIDVLNHETGETYCESYDKLILAPGASPFVPPMDGVDAQNVLTLRNVEDTDRIASFVEQDATRRAVVVGAGFIGLEMVEQLAHRGIDTTLVELQPQVLPLLDPEMAAPLEDELIEKGVALHLGKSVAKVVCAGEPNRGTAVELSDGTVIETDLVILGIGVRPNVELAQKAEIALGSSGGIATDAWMRTSDENIYAVGDAAEYPYRPTDSRMRVALAGPANRAGRLAGQHAATGSSDEMQPVLGTSIVRVFGKTAAITGLSESLAQRLNIDVKAVTIIAKDHAGYYPGAELLTLKLLYSPSDGKVLGAQVVGGAGCDKRIDVIATAMHFDATTRQLAGLDLAYAPPFGAAKDPVHLAAFVACNELDGFESFAPADKSLEGVQVLDVRTPAEVSKTPIAGATAAINIPLDELRDRMSELDTTRPLVVTCAAGLRAHVAVRMLLQRGFDAKNLTGGATVRNRAYRHR